ncbi:MAG: hypothetical protein MUF49_19175 [Oculatellaceae cyanobacterium Prado106]|jgi:hypothetical protein|nr:hypothetical protein [Oculatellaceae cyanobacterium Prado106]
MDSENRQLYQVVTPETSTSICSIQDNDLGRGSQQANLLGGKAVDAQPSVQPINSSTHSPSVVEGLETDKILDMIHSGQLWMVNSRRRNGLILCKAYHAEFAGPGAAVGGFFDMDCKQVIPVGNLSLLRPENHEERQKAYLIRRQWVRLTQQFTDQSMPVQRAQMILNQFENYFDQETIARIPDEAFAQLVGVLPYSVRMARRKPGVLNVKLKTQP